MFTGSCRPLSLSYSSTSGLRHFSFFFSDNDCVLYSEQGFLMFIYSVAQDVRACVRVCVCVCMCVCVCVCVKERDRERELCVCFLM